jgi:dephospho-CoA kinase
MDRGDARSAPRILGLTGPIGCGKTTVGDVLLDLGARERIDADHVVHALMAPGTATTRQIRDAFGDGVIAVDGSVDRRRLAAIVFRDAERLRALEAITHPAVRESIRTRLDQLCGQNGVVVVDAVRLLQSDLLPLVEEVWVVRCAPDAQLERLTTLRGMAPDDARARNEAQPCFDHPRVARVIDNSGSLADLRREVAAAWGSFVVKSL